MLYAGEPENPGWWLGFAGFAAWMLLPYAIASYMTHRLGGHPSARMVLLVTALGVSLSSTWLLYEAFIRHIDAQSGIVFAVLPMYQLIGLVPLVAIASWLARWRD